MFCFVFVLASCPATTASGNTPTREVRNHGLSRRQILCLEVHDSIVSMRPHCDAYMRQSNVGNVDYRAESICRTVATFDELCVDMGQ
jgi:hypothetical protein